MFHSNRWTSSGIFLFLRNVYHKTLLGKLLKQLYALAINRLVSDENFIMATYRKVTGKKPDLKHPKTLNEKICWLKLYDRTPLHTKCADKYAVREYISQQIGEDYLVPLLYHSNNPEDINDATIPSVPCIIKTNHDSGGGIMVYDKSKIDWKNVHSVLKKRMKTNYYLRSREWQYKHIEPIIIVEELLQDKNGNTPSDLKLHVINGKVNMIQVDMGRGTENHYRNWYDKNWKREPYKWSSPKGNGKYTDPSDEDAEKPATLKKMIALSEVLAKPFDYVRIDWYDVDGKLYFGEITFHHDGGYQPILPEKWDRILGDRLVLTK